MRIITGRLDGTADAYPLSRIGGRENVLALDVETTGPSPEKDQIYLIGCAFAAQDHWELLQWLDETGSEEADILTSFLLFAKKYSVLLHYNGTRFDLPFLSRRIIHSGLQSVSPLSSMESVDLYQYLKPYQRLLSLPDLRQQTVEQFVGTGRTEDRSGRELVELYHRFLSCETGAGSPDTSNGDGAESDPGAALLGHNRADVAGLTAISRVFVYADLFSAELTVYKAQANMHRDVDGNPSQELIMYAAAEELPEDAGIWDALSMITVQRDDCYIALQGRRITIKVPVCRGRLRHYYANYKDYYYLPELDQAIHKSIASFVDRDRREQATGRTCYTARDGCFLPQWTLLHEPIFRKTREEKTAWFEFRDEMKQEKAFFTEYANHVYRHVLGI